MGKFIDNSLTYFKYRKTYTNKYNGLLDLVLIHFTQQRVELLPLVGSLNFVEN